MTIVLKCDIIVKTTILFCLKNIGQGVTYMNKKIENVDEVFAWKDQYCVGVEEIDSAHIRLFTIVRRLLKNLFLNDYEKNKRTCIEVVKYLKQYTIEHFAQEEAFQLKIGYGGYPNHKRIHDNMREITIPSLEKQMEATDYSEESVEHFAGVCAGWLTAHVMLEDQAMVGKVKSQWSAELDTDAITLLQAKAEEFMNKIFQMEIEAENLNYDGYDIGQAFYYYIIFKGEENKVYRTATVISRDLLCHTIGKLMGKEVRTLDEITLSITSELIKSFSENFIKQYVKENVNIIGDGAVDKSRFETDFKTSHPDISMLWNTRYGRIAFSVKMKKTKLTH